MAIRFFLILGTWLAAAAWVANNFAGSMPWVLLAFWPGALIPIWVAIYLNAADREKFAAVNGLETVYGGNQFRNGSFFAGYRDPVAGEFVEPPSNHGPWGKRPPTDGE